MRTVQAGFKSGLGSESAADLLVRVGPTILVDAGLRSHAPAGEGDQPHRVILGRTFLRPCRLNYDGQSGAVEIVED